MKPSPFGLYFSLAELNAVAATLANDAIASTADIARACSWASEAAWGELKQMEHWNYVEKLDNPPFTNGTKSVRWRVKAGAALEAKIRLEERLIRENADKERLFVRCGGWCRCQRSQIGLSNEFETGVSAYHARSVDQHWQPTDRAFWRKNFGSLGGNSRWYLIAGETIGLGSDAEPLLTSARARAHLDWNSESGVFEVQEEAPEAHPIANHPSCERN